MRADRDMFGRPIPANLRTTFRRAVLAEVLWEYGEVALAEAALELSEDDLHQVQLLDVWHHLNDPEPDDGPRLQNGRIMARAMIEFAEGAPRDTTRRRRRTRPPEQAYTYARRPQTPAERGLDTYD